MDREEMHDILIDGSKEEMIGLTCPDCHGPIGYTYSPEADSFTTKCKCSEIRGCGLFHEPNCVEYFGVRHQF